MIKTRPAVRIGIDDERYPALLKDIHDPPSQLYCIGDLSLLSMQCVAVVGTRRCSPYGRWAAGEIARAVAGSGTCVVSGMASGIDSAAHKGALDAGGKTIAVFGTGVDICFPASNAGLYERIAESGLIVSEYEPGEGPMAWHFPARNRIISGLSRATIVVEGAIKSGSMITASLALEQGRDVFAVPGNINQPNSRGVNKLIADGASPIMDLGELPQLLGISKDGEKKALAKLSSEERRYYEIVKFSPGISPEAAALEADDGAAYAAAILTLMEIKGLIRRDGSALFIR